MNEAPAISLLKPRARSIIRGRIFASSVLAVAIVFFIYDLAVDALLEGEFGSPHFVIEFIVFVGVSMSLVFNVRDIRRLRVRLSHPAVPRGTCPGAPRRAPR